MAAAMGVESERSDLERYMLEVDRLYGVEMDWQSAMDYYQESEEIDVIRIILAILVSRFTDNGYYLLLIYGIIFGFFYSRNIWYVMDRLEGKLKPVTGLLIACLFLVNPIWNMGGFRFYTAVHVYIYGLLPFLFTGKRGSLIWCLVTPYIFHFSFLLPIIFLGIFLVFGSRLQLYFYLFLATTFIGEIDIKQFNQVVDSYFSENFAKRSSGYRDEEKVGDFVELSSKIFSTSKSWYAILYVKGFRWVLIGLLVILFAKSRAFLLLDKNLTRVLSFTFLLFSMANLMMSIPSGQRFFTLAAMLATTVLIIYIQNNKQERLMEQIIPITFPFLGLFIVVSIRMGLYITSLVTVFGNPIIAIITFGNNVSINDVIK